MADDRHLLRINVGAQRVYPVMQFDGDRPVSGLAHVMDILGPHITAHGVAAWLTGTLPALDDRRAIDALRSGDVDAVIAAAHRRAANAQT